MIWAVRHFRPYLYGHRFTLQTDHRALQWLMTTEILQGRLARWALALQEYNITVEYKMGCSHKNADALSRSSESVPTDEEVESNMMDRDMHWPRLEGGGSMTEFPETTIERWMQVVITATSVGVGSIFLVTGPMFCGKIYNAVGMGYKVERQGNGSFDY